MPFDTNADGIDRMGLTNVVEQLQTTAIIERSNSGMNPGASGWSRPTENDVAHTFGANDRYRLFRQ